MASLLQPHRCFGRSQQPYPASRHVIVSSRARTAAAGPRRWRTTAARAAASSEAAAAQQPAAVITGSSSGIGSETALRLAKQGWRVFAGVRKLSDAERLQGDSSLNITPVVLDVTSQESLAAARKQVEEQLGGAGLRLLINNAGVGLVAPAEFVPLDQWRGVLDVNLQGPLAVTQAFLPLLRQSQPQQARIINISSVAGHLALPFWSAYNVSKAGLDMLTECLRYELQPQGMSVVLIKPGPVVTPIWGKTRALSEGFMTKMPAEAQVLYRATLDKMSEMVEKTEETAIDVSECVDVIVQAASAPKPKDVYLVGKDASLNYWLKRLIPDEMWTSMMSKSLSQS